MQFNQTFALFAAWLRFPTWALQHSTNSAFTNLGFGVVPLGVVGFGLVGYGKVTWQK